jgi:hypothetical protein
MRTPGSSATLGAEMAFAAFAKERLGTLRIHVAPQSGAPMFVGIARTATGDRYLGSVSHEAITGMAGASPEYAMSPGGVPSGQPARLAMWAAQTSGRHDMALTCPVRHGAWTIVVMNADASRGI